MNNETNNEMEENILENEENLDAELEDNDEIPSKPNPAISNEVSEQETLKTNLKESENKYLRLLAEFDNFRKQKAKEINDFRKYEGRQLILELLEVVDNLERAFEHEDLAPEKFKEGITLIYKNIQDILAKWEVKPEAGIGQKFDPEKQNAISKITDQNKEIGTIVGELKKAYYYKDKLIRFGEVVVVTE